MIDDSKLDKLQARAQRLAIVILVIFVALIGYSAYRLHGLQRQIHETTADLEIKMADLDEMKVEEAALEDKIARLRQERGVLMEINSRAAAEDPQLIRKATKDTIESNPQSAASLPRLFPHISSETQRSLAKDLATALEASGFLVPGIENVGPIAPRSAQLRYFRESEEAAKDVEQILAILEASGLSAEPQFTAGFEDSTAISRRHYELWFGTESVEPGG